jgi:hypothetical protein
VVGAASEASGLPSRELEADMILQLVLPSGMYTLLRLEGASPEEDRLDCAVAPVANHGTTASSQVS